MNPLLILVILSIGFANAILDQNQLRNNIPNIDAFEGNIWAVLVAGSNSYENYRHQADICHAYHILRRHGVAAERIITMMYDDIANNTKNPTKGIIINHPGGPNVYEGIKIDYSGKEVTPQMFLKVLEADGDLVSKGRKVLQSGSKDHVFVFFADHGAPGLIAFPDSELLATDLAKTLKKMNTQKRYRKMVLYIEACESGSMFDGHLTPDMDIIALTAANPEEPSYACYWDDERETFLGDLFSIEWMEDSDSLTDLDHETIQQQFARVKKLTANSSHVMEYGDVTIGRAPVGQFQGEGRIAADEAGKRVPRPVVTDIVPSHDVPLIIAERKMQKASTEQQKRIRTAVYQGLKSGREYMGHAMRMLVDRMRQHLPHQQTGAGAAATEQPQVDIMSQRLKLTRHDCYQQLYTSFDAHCFDLSSHPFALRYLYVFVNVCEQMDQSSVMTHVNLMSDLIADECHKSINQHPFRSIA